MDHGWSLLKSVSHKQFSPKYTSSQHPDNILTSQNERDVRPSALDVHVQNQNAHSGLAFFRKQTFTGLSKKHSSAVPLRHEVNLLQFLCYRVCKSDIRFVASNKVCKFKSVFQNLTCARALRCCCEPYFP